MKKLLSLLIIGLLMFSSTLGAFAETKEIISTPAIKAAVVTKVSAPKLSSLTVNKQNQASIYWNNVSKAEKYRVFRKTNGGPWKKLTDTAFTAYTDLTAKAGNKYTYAVRCVNKSGKSYTSPLSASITITPVTEPKLKKVANVSNGIQVTWNKVNKAENYRIFRKTNGSSVWYQITDTTSTSYIDKTAQAGVIYTYSVRCTTKNKRYYTSSWDTKGLTIKRPEIKLPSNSKDVHAKYLSLPGGAPKTFTVLSLKQMYTQLQSIIDTGKIICYPNDDMTKGVKYLAGHNPGAMSHINTIKVGSKVRLMNAKNQYQDYKVIERVQPQTRSKSFADIVFTSTGQDAWTMMHKRTENALIIQFCIGGKNTFFYCRAI
jgi:hypothetical protein